LLAVKHPNIGRAMHFIWEHAHEPINVADVVRVAVMSRRGLHEAFLQQIGRTPGDEIRRVRIDTAKRRLAETDDKIETIALCCGYQSLNSFCVAFRNITDKSPGQFRREARGLA
jgi:LacI family transcriptional regulator